MEKQQLAENVKKENGFERNKNLDCIKYITNELIQKNSRIKLINENLERYSSSDEEEKKDFLKRKLLSELSETEDLLISIIFEAFNNLNDTRKQIDELSK